MYILLQKKFTNYGMVYVNISEAESLEVIESRLKTRVISGEPLGDFRVVKDIEFKFDCVIEWNLDEENA